MLRLLVSFLDIAVDCVLLSGGVSSICQLDINMCFGACIV